MSSRVQPPSPTTLPQIVLILPLAFHKLKALGLLPSYEPINLLRLRIQLLNSTDLRAAALPRRLRAEDMSKLLVQVKIDLLLFVPATEAGTRVGGARGGGLLWKRLRFGGVLRGRTLLAVIRRS
ncbi:unnamed protein product [Sphagnum balticum]